MADDLKPPAAPPAGQPDLAQQLADLSARVTASEKKAADAEAEKNRLTAQLQREAVKSAAVAAGVIDPSLLDHLPMQGTEVKDGKVVGVADALAKLKTDFPKIFGAAPAAAPPAAGGAGTPPPAAGGEKPPAPPAPVPVVTPIAGVPPPPAGSTTTVPAKDPRKMTKEEHAAALKDYRTRLENGTARLA